MNTKFVNATLNSLEEEIKVLRSLLVEDVKTKKKFSSLKGIWKGKIDLSFEDIKKAEFKPKGEI